MYVCYVCLLHRLILPPWQTKNKKSNVSLKDTGFVYLKEKLTGFLLHSHQELKHCIYSKSICYMTIKLTIPTESVTLFNKVK